MTDFKVDKLGYAHVPIVCQLDAAVFPMEAYRFTPELLYQRFDGMNAGYVALVNGKQLCGYVVAYYQPPIMAIVSLAITPGHQRRGVGSYLLNKVESLGIAKGCELVIAKVPEPLTPAQLFLRSRGYSCIKIDKKATDGATVQYAFEKRLVINKEETNQ